MCYYPIAIDYKNDTIIHERQTCFNFRGNFFTKAANSNSVQRSSTRYFKVTIIQNPLKRLRSFQFFKTHANKQTHISQNTAYTSSTYVINYPFSSGPSLVLQDILPARTIAVHNNVRGKHPFFTGPR